MISGNNGLCGKSVLLVDDEEGVRMALALLLREGLGLEVVLAADGAQGLELYQSRKFDYVLTDYNMPGMRGDALAKAVRAQNPLQRIVMISGFIECVRRDDQHPSSVNAMISKPCRLDELARALQD